MKYRMTNIASTQDCGFNPKYALYYMAYTGYTFEAGSDEDAIKVAEYFQEKADKLAIESGLNKDDEEYMKNAPSLPGALVRVELDEDGDEIEIPSWNW